MNTQLHTLIFATLVGSLLAFSGVPARAAPQAAPPPGQAVQPQNPEETAEEIKKTKKKKQQQEQAEQERQQQELQREQQRQPAVEERKREQQEQPEQQQRAVEQRKRQQQEQQQQQKQRTVEERQRQQQLQQQQQAVEERKRQQQQEQQRQTQLQEQQEQQLQRQRQQQEQRQQQKRVSQQEQQQRIRKEEQQLAAYRRNIELREKLAERDAEILRQQKRIQHLRFQEQYEQRLRAQRAELNRARYDYYNDPFYYTAPNYRYRRGGNYYRTNQYGIRQLERALQAGYNEGFRAGRADREDRWRYDFRSAFAYRDANYGYEGRYIDQDEYNHYFRQGFERGYDDGYYDRRKYGRRNDGGGINDEWLIAGAVVAAIIGYELLTD